MLAQTSEVLRRTKTPDPRSQTRKIVGVYIGWRGRSIDLSGLDNITYWDRKAVAEQVGKGGVTELLLRLERAVVDPEVPNKNLYGCRSHTDADNGWRH